MKIKTSELTGAALDWAVATIEKPGVTGIAADGKLRAMPRKPFGDPVIYTPSTDWSQGGPIIEREGIWLRGPHDCCKPDGTHVMSIDYWYAHINHKFVRNCETPLIAAMRCYVASKLGEEVDVPEDIL